jgi:hypothetical protein|tara:strand:+ start:338 stop:823 length:486 start_codon:yes stop_codon:yes gene_type:complete
MIDDIRQGLFFGLNSGVITTSGLISGLVQTNISKNLLIVSIISLAISDSASEAYGLYLSKKAEDIKDFSSGPLYSLIALFITKFVIVISFLIPLLFTRNLKIFKNMSWVLGWGVFLLIILDLQLCKLRNESFWSYIFPHLTVLGLVIFLTRYFGNMVNKLT